VQDPQDEVRHCDPSRLLGMPKKGPGRDLYDTREGQAEPVRIFPVLYA
jgi:hypothetical protein